MLHRFPLMAAVYFAITFIAQVGVAQEQAATAVPTKPTIEEIKVEFSSSPSRAGGADRVLGENWVIVSVKFGTSDPFVDTLTMKVYIDGLEDPNKKGFTVFDSQVTFINVTPSRDHYARFYIPPTAALRYGGQGGKGFRQSNVFVSLAAGSEEPVTKMMRQDNNPNWYQQGRPAPDVLMPFYESPWWPSDAGLYQQFKKR